MPKTSTPTFKNTISDQHILAKLFECGRSEPSSGRSNEHQSPSSKAIFVNWAPLKNKKGKWIKPPEYGHPFGKRRAKDPVTLEQAFDPRVTAFPGQLGLVALASHQYLAIDLDGTPPSEELVALLRDHPTFASASPSAKPYRWRILYALPSAEDKAYLLPIPKHIDPATNSDMAIYISSKNYTTLTTAPPIWPRGSKGRGTLFSDSIAVITVERLLQAFPWAQDTSSKLLEEMLAEIPTHDATAHDATAHDATAHDATAHDTNTLRNQALAEYESKLSEGALPPFPLWKEQVPLGENNPTSNIIRRRFNWDHRDLWVYGCMALYEAFKHKGVIEVYEIAKEWSKTDEDLDQYTDEAFESLWKSITSASDRAQASITNRTYKAMFTAASPEWHSVKPKSNIPIGGDHNNFTILLNFLDISLVKDTITLDPVVKASDQFSDYFYDKDATFPTGKDTAYIVSRLSRFIHHFNLNPTIQQLTSNVINALAGLSEREYVNPMSEYISSLPPYDPDTEPDYLTEIGTDVIVRDQDNTEMSQELHTTLVRKWMLSICKHFWKEELSNPTHAESPNEGMLILSEPMGNTGKSTLSRKILPKEVINYLAYATPKKRDRDWTLLLSQHLLVDIDESTYPFDFDTMDDCKKVITSYRFTDRGLFATKALGRVNNATILASTNKVRQNIPRGGERRYWWLSVESIDLDYFDKIDRWRIYAQIKYELSHYHRDQKNAPWVLTDDERLELVKVLSDYRAESSMTIILKDMYDFSEVGWEDTYARVATQTPQEAMRTISQIAKELEFSGYGKFKISQVKSALRDLLRDPQTAPKLYVRVLGSRILRGEHKVGNSPYYLLPVYSLPEK